MSNATIKSLVFVGEFFYTLTHGHPWTAVLMGVSLVIAGRERWLLRIFMAAVLIALLHDTLTGHLSEDLR